MRSTYREEPRGSIIAIHWESGSVFPPDTVASVSYNGQRRYMCDNTYELNQDTLLIAII